MKGKTHNITGVFKNIPGKGTDETALAKKHGTQHTYNPKTSYVLKKLSARQKNRHRNGFHSIGMIIYNAL